MQTATAASRFTNAQRQLTADKYRPSWMPAASSCFVRSFSWSATFLSFCISRWYTAINL